MEPREEGRAAKRKSKKKIAGCACRGVEQGQVNDGCVTTKSVMGSVDRLDGRLSFL